jgi:hypothetical protein
MSNRMLVFTTTLATLLATSAFAGATGNQGGFSLDLEGVVPVICKASVNAARAPAGAGHVDLGKLSEFCNNPGGYQVWVDYSPELANATLLVDGQSVPLSASGATMISGSSTAAVAVHDLALDLPDGGAQGSISVRVVAL